MNNRENFIFWQIAYSLISEHGYRLIQLFDNQKELWLEKLENKHAPIVRLMLENFDWSNTMQRDIEFSAVNGERIRKQLGKSELHLTNIYVSEFPPVDDYESRITQPFVHPEGNKTVVKTLLLTNDKAESGLRAISQQLLVDLQFQINEQYSDQEVELVKKSSIEHSVKKAKAEREILRGGKPFFTYVFILIQCAVFFWMEVNGGSTNTSNLIKYGAKVNQLIYQGEWWRFFTPVFIHIGFLHLAMNTLSLYYLGVEVERIYGRFRFLIIYLFAGFAGVVASFLFSSTLSAGASGAIFGCFGALLYFGVTYPKLFMRTMGMNLFAVLALNLVFGFSVSGIDNAGHLGGLAGGFLAAGLVHFPKKAKPFIQVLFLAASAVLVWGSLTYGFSNSDKTLDESSTIVLAQDYIQQNNYDAAYDTLKHYEQQGSEISERTYFLLSYVEIKKGLLSDAKPHLLKAIELNPDFHEAYYNLALIYLEENDLQKAKENAERAVELMPGESKYSNLVQEINQYLGSQVEE
ncbi:rhomboid family intramembrane serine protease [Bacillus sp. FJAT-29814]|uniref:rhomboid family protein n=1 Tax=Bacillus sp. FJAT-29814 TaxID=1729688 RepID=UPI000833D042|nr:rhomboid family intramembrane serine protease [Bacillus sp. FJAT-29814]